MAEEKKNFIFYTSWKTWLDAMTLEQKGMWLDWVMTYCDDQEPNLPDDPVVKMGCLIAKENLKRDLVKYQAKVESIKSAREKKKQQETNSNQTEINMKSVSNQTEISSVNVNVNVNDNVNVNELNKENVVFNNTTKEDDTSSQIRSSFFERFWKIYPKKVGKDKCKKWFLNKSRKIDESLIFKIVEAIEKQKTSAQWLKDDGQFIPHPYTWLNRSGWEDELDTSGVHQATSSPIDSSISEDIDLSFLDLELSGDDNSNAN